MTVSFCLHVGPADKQDLYCFQEAFTTSGMESESSLFQRIAHQQARLVGRTRGHNFRRLAGTDAADLLQHSQEFRIRTSSGSLCEETSACEEKKT